MRYRCVQAYRFTREIDGFRKAQARLGDQIDDPSRFGIEVIEHSICQDLLLDEHGRKGDTLIVFSTPDAHALRILRFHVHDLNLVPSTTDYRRLGKGPKHVCASPRRATSSLKRPTRHIFPGPVNRRSIRPLRIPISDPLPATVRAFTSPVIAPSRPPPSESFSSFECGSDAICARGI